MIKRSYKKIVFNLTFASIMLSLLVTPKAFADGFVPCVGADDCNFDMAIKLLNTIANFIIFRLPLILLIILFAYNGYLLIYNSDRPAIKKIIKKNLINVFIGYFLVLGAYAIVKTFILLIAQKELTFKVFFN